MPVASTMDAGDAAGPGSNRLDAGEAALEPPRYNLRSRRGHGEVTETSPRRDLEPDGLDRRTGATVVISGVDAKISPLRRDAVNETDRSRPRDREEPFVLNRGRRASSRSSDAGSEFSSAPGSPVSAGGSRRAPPS